MITQLTKLDEPRLNAWYAKAIHDPKVRPFLTMDPYTPLSVEKIEDSDWSKAVWMDETDTGRLLVHFDRQRKRAQLSLHVLGNNPGIAARLMLFAIRTIPRRYDMEYFSFAVSVSNKKWLDKLAAKFPAALWGIEPHAAWDPEADENGAFVGAANFLVSLYDIR